MRVPEKGNTWCRISFLSILGQHWQMPWRSVNNCGIIIWNRSSSGFLSDVGIFDDGDVLHGIRFAHDEGNSRAQRAGEKNYTALFCSFGIPEIINGLKKR